MEELKQKIKIDDISKYDDNYIYTLIEDYLDEFKNGNVVSKIKDSPIYIEVASKIDELDKRKDSLNDKLTEKKEKLEDKKRKFNEFKEKYCIQWFFNSIFIHFPISNISICCEGTWSCKHRNMQLRSEPGSVFLPILHDGN